MKPKRFDKMWIGMLIGLVMPTVGFAVYGWYWSWKFYRPFSYFVNNIFIETPALRSSILSLSLIINLLPFFVFLRTDRYKSARGVMAAVFLYVPFVIYFRFY